MRIRTIDELRRAYNFDEMKSVIEQMKDIEIPDVIEESGSNANGSYLKFADGTMICSVAMTVTDQAINNAYGSLFQGARTWVYPASFTERPSVYCSEFRWGSGASWGTIGNTPSATSANLRGIDNASRAAGTNTNISAMAIGRWL